MSLKGSNILILVMALFIFSCIAVPVVSLAEEITFKEAVELGLEQNNDLKGLSERITELERDLALIRAQQDWQIELGADYEHAFEGDNKELVNNTLEEKNSVDLIINKKFASGFNINSKVTVTEEDSSPELSLTFSQQIYPLPITDLDKQYYKVEKELTKVKEKYLEQKVGKVLTWLDSYLTLKRLIENRAIYEKCLQQAEANLTEVGQRQEIGESGKVDILTARLSIKEAEYQLEEVNNKIEEALLDIKQNLGLNNNQVLKVDDSQYLVEMRERAKTLADKYMEDNNLMNTIVDNSYDIFANHIEREILKQELEWLKSEGRTEASLTGNYNTDQDEVTAGINISYQLYDGGQREIKYDDKQAEINVNKSDYKKLYEDLKQQLKQYKNSLGLSQMKLEQEKLRRERSRYRAKIAREQFEIGLIDYLEYQENWIDSREIEVNVRSYQDKLFINRLKLVKFVETKKCLTNCIFSYIIFNKRNKD